MSEILLALSTAAKLVGVPHTLLLAVCMTETNLKHVDSPNDGKTTSYGVCQVKLETAQFMGKVHKKKDLVGFQESDMRSVQNNAMVAAFYLKYQIKRYDGDFCKAVAAYNAGRYKESLENPGQPFNLIYVQKVRSKISDEEFAKELDCNRDLVAIRD